MKPVRIISLVISCAVWASCSKKSTGGGGVFQPQPPVDKNWKFEATPSWSDEFSANGLPDASKWSYDVGGSGWGNNELQYYTNADPDNVKVENGNLVITALRETFSGMNFTSTRLVSKNKGDFLYGRVEVNAKLPAGRGTWPAIWMLPTDQAYGTWPRSGEIDIMEHVGYDPNRVHFSIHTEAFNHINNTQRTTSSVIPTALTEFHKYRVDWTPYAVRGYFDDQLVFTFVNDGSGSAKWPFDKRFHLLMNIAVGGNWGGVQGVDNAAFPTSMMIDYVRYYKMLE